MIKKLERHITGGEDMVAISCPPDPQDMMDKINELVDTVNALVKENNIHEKQIDELQMKLEPEKVENIYTKTCRMDKEFAEKELERIEAVVKMRECQLRCACDGLEYITCTNNMLDAQFQAKKSLDAVDAIYDLHKGKKIENGFLGEPHKRG